MLSSGSAIGQGDPEHRSEALLRLSVFSCQHRHMPAGSSSPNNRPAGWQLNSSWSSVLPEMASLCKSGRLWWSLSGFSAWLCGGIIVRCWDSLGRLCGLSEVQWVTWVQSGPLVHPWTGSGLELAAVGRDRHQGPAGGMAVRGSAPLQPLCAVSVWKVPHLPVDLFSPLECAGNAETKLCFTFSGSK